ncbi:MAG: hypothetical protein R3362_03400 [Rhodothermales bacterium]|nr:hypothetical protein [Rhodothermales bacterium]
MKPTLGLRREDLSKVGERRAALTPPVARALTADGYRLLVQPAGHPETGETKRAFADAEYADAGATVTEDLAAADLVFGLKELEVAHLLPDRAYAFFSHTHKGQVKNRPLLRAMMERGLTVFDYELLTDDAGRRHLTAFTTFAGYAGMVDTLWALGERLRREGIAHPVAAVPQSISVGDLERVREILRRVGAEIAGAGTPPELPPLVVTVLGRGKTSAGALAMLDLLPTVRVTPDALPGAVASGDRRRVYVSVLEVHEMYRPRPDADVRPDAWAAMSEPERMQLYFDRPALFTSNLDRVLPHTSVLMNCTLWSPDYPRVLPNALLRQAAAAGSPLRAIGDITCDPEGSIECSRETWIDAPVYTYAPASGAFHDGFDGPGVVVMAVTNLPCEFARDASLVFSRELAPLLPGLLAADLRAPFERAGLPPTWERAAILWQGALTPPFAYMESFAAA